MIEIIPAIDIIGGRCVRLSQGDYGKMTAYEASPADMARRYADTGLSRIHVVDLDGAKAGRPVNLAALEAIAHVDGVEVEWGGGLKTDEDVAAAFDSGARYGVIGSVAARNPELMARWLDTYGADRMVLGADVRDGKVAVSGWLDDTDLTAGELIERFLPHGLSQAIVTDISRDGMLQGPSYDLYERLSETYPQVKFTVSGGISSMADIERLDCLGLPRVIVGKAIYEGHVTLADLAAFTSSRN